MKAVLLINLGTPEAPTTLAVRQYLKQFLSDPKVIDLPAIIRWLLVNIFILPFRSRRSALLYRKIWSPEGSPLLVHSKQLVAKLKLIIDDNFVVALGMRYGQPSIESALQELQKKQIHELIVLPLFPQFSSSVGGSILEEVRAKAIGFEKVTIIDSFFEGPHYIDSMITLIREHINVQEILQNEIKQGIISRTRFLFSYHGIPMSQNKDNCRSLFCDDRKPCPLISEVNRHCYRAQCFATSRLLADKLGLTDQQFSVVFQSRIGYAAWIGPYMDQYLIKLSKEGVKNIVVICPSFVADCLETLEEIGIRAKARWRQLGGDVLQLIPSLNSHSHWVESVAAMIMKVR